MRVLRSIWIISSQTTESLRRRISSFCKWRIRGRRRLHPGIVRWARDFHDKILFFSFFSCVLHEVYCITRGNKMQLCIVGVNYRIYCGTADGLRMIVTPPRLGWGPTSFHMCCLLTSHPAMMIIDTCTNLAECFLFRRHASYTSKSASSALPHVKNPRSAHHSSRQERWQVKSTTQPNATPPSGL